MAGITFEQFFRAIAEQESGNSYKAVGVQTKYGRAYGKYQVLESNIWGWTAKYYGRSLSAKEFLNNPQAQEAVARGVLKSYWDKYGARGAAAAWYGGPGSAGLHMSTKPQPGGPSIKGYVDSVLAKAAKYPAGGGATKSVTSSSTGEVAQKPMSADEMAEQYGFVQGLLNSTPELKNLFNKAVKEQWTAQKFQAELRDTKWWKTHSNTERDFLTLQYGDPKSANQKLDQAYVQVRQIANQLGIVETREDLKKIQSLYKTWAYNMVAKGWNEQQLRAEVVKYIKLGDYQEGEAGENLMKLKEMAYNYGVTMSQYWYESRAKNIVSGAATLTDYQNEIKKQAKTLYPQFSKQIDGGQTVMDIASPYIQSMGQILELPAGSIDLLDPTIKTALQNKNKATGKNEVMPLWQFENQLRSDPRWKKTQNAQNSLMQVAHQVLADFGVAY